MLSIKFDKEDPIVIYTSGYLCLTKIYTVATLPITY